MCELKKFTTSSIPNPVFAETSKLRIPGRPRPFITSDPEDGCGFISIVPAQQFRCEDSIIQFVRAVMDLHLKLGSRLNGLFGKVGRGV
jgi:hypothetical protein